MRVCWQQNWKRKWDFKCSVNLSFCNYVVKTPKHYFEKIIVARSWPHWSNHLTFLCDTHSYPLWTGGKRRPMSNIFRAGERTQKEAFMPSDLILKNYKQWSKFVFKTGASGWKAEVSDFLGPCRMWWHRETWPWPRGCWLWPRPCPSHPQLYYACKGPHACRCGHLILCIRTPSAALDCPGPGRRWHALWDYGWPWEERPEKEAVTDLGNGLGANWAKHFWDLVTCR